MHYVLGIDVGTTGTKSLLFSEKGSYVGQAYKGYDLITPRVGVSEQRAEDWWNAVVCTVREVVSSAGIEGSDVVGISLSLQGGTLVPVGEDFEPIANARVWNDARCAVQRQEYLDEVGEAHTMYEKTGWSLGNGLLALEIREMRDNAPELFEKTAMFMSVPDYISYKMTGIPAIDISDIGINQTGNVRTGDYDEDLLSFMNITKDRLPAIVHTGDVIGHLTERASAELGLSTDCVLVAGAHDQYAVALGAGCTHDGDIVIGSGTCWVVTALSESSNFDSGIAQSQSATPGLWGSCWSLSSGGVCLDWMRKYVSLSKEGDLIDYDTVNAEVSKRKAAEDGLFFYPFSGYAQDRKAFSKASFIGLDLSHDRFDMMRAVMEGVCFQIRWMMEYFKSKPSPEEGLKLAGGAAKSAVWCQILSDVTGLPVRVPELADLSCVGAAALAGTGSGLFRDLDEACSLLSVAGHVVNPDPERSRIYSELYEVHKSKAVLLSKIYGL